MSPLRQASSFRASPRPARALSVTSVLRQPGRLEASRLTLLLSVPCVSVRVGTVSALSETSGFLKLFVLCRVSVLTLAMCQKQEGQGSELLTPRGLLQTFAGGGVLSVVPDGLRSNGWSAICFFFERKPFFCLFFSLQWSVAMSGASSGQAWTEARENGAGFQQEVSHFRIREPLPCTREPS